MKFTPLLLAGVLVAVGISGCTQAPDLPPPPVEVRSPYSSSVLSPALHKALPPESLAVASSVDGKILANAVYRPDTDEPVPVFINFSPYWGDTAMHGGDAFARYLVEEYVPRGYAVVLAAVRGTGQSEGCFQIGGDLELQDAHDVVDFFAKQPWSNGNIAAGGKSYDSTTQNGLVAKFPHPALKGLFHVSGITDMYRYNAKDGVLYVNGLQFTPRYYVTQAIDEYVGATNDAGSPMDESPASLLRLADDLACPELAAHLTSGQGTAAHGMRDAYWQERNWNLHLPDSTWNGSIFFVHGLQDWNVKPDHLEPWLQIVQAKGIPVLGWLHQDTSPGSGGHVYPMRTDWNETMLRWLDHTLKGIDTHMDELWGFEAQGSDGTWRRSAAWPPAMEGELVLESGMPLQADTQNLPQMRIAGIPYAEVTVVPTHPDDVVRVILYETGAGQKYITEGVRRLALSDDLTTPQTVTPGVPMTVNLTFFPVDHVLSEDWALSVQLGDVAMAASTPAGFFIRPEQGASVEYQKVVVHLPQAALDEMARQPEPMACFTC